MTIFRRKIATIALLVLGGCATSISSHAGVAGVAQSFCAAIIANDEAKAEGLMSDSLRDAIAKARVASRAFEMANPGDKPPLGDGLPLAAYPDVPSNCRPSDVSANSVALSYEFADDPKAGWQDRLVVEQSAAGTILISDILYGPDHQERLSAVLAEIARGPL
jgi:hypothetical protein